MVKDAYGHEVCCGDGTKCQEYESDISKRPGRYCIEIVVAEDGTVDFWFTADGKDIVTPDGPAVAGRTFIGEIQAVSLDVDMKDGLRKFGVKEIHFDRPIFFKCNKNNSKKG